eukprot:1151130-Pelagomonas_calceolata.AAC.2
MGSYLSSIKGHFLTRGLELAGSKWAYCSAQEAASQERSIRWAHNGVFKRHDSSLHAVANCEDKQGGYWPCGNVQDYGKFLERGAAFIIEAVCAVGFMGCMVALLTVLITDWIPSHAGAVSNKYKIG